MCVRKSRVRETETVNDLGALYRAMKLVGVFLAEMLLKRMLVLCFSVYVSVPVSLSLVCVCVSVLLIALAKGR